MEHAQEFLREASQVRWMNTFRFLLLFTVYISFLVFLVTFLFLLLELIGVFISALGQRHQASIKHL
jgi:hypothetical protein